MGAHRKLSGSAQRGQDRLRHGGAPESEVLPVSELKRTPLHELHRELGARLVPYAGWEMPVQYPQGIIAEHLRCRDAAALFDVSHMGQVRLEGPDAARALERLVPADIVGLAPGRARYTQLTDVFQEKNGIYAFDRRPKFDVDRLREVQSQRAAYEDLPPR